MSAPNMDDWPRGVSILELPNASVTQIYEGEESPLAKGQLSVLVVTVNVEDPFASPPPGKEKSSTDIWLVFTVGEEFSLPIRSSQSVHPERSTSSYLFPSLDVPHASLRLTLSHGTSETDRQALEDTLAQYCAFKTDDAPGAGQIELLNEHGEVMGTLAGEYQFRESDEMKKSGSEKDPVLIDLDELTASDGAMVKSDGKGMREVAVRTVPAQKSDDWLLKGAGLISTGIVAGAGFLATQIGKAADSHIARSRPASPGIPASAGALAPPVRSSTAGTTGTGRAPLTFNSNTKVASQKAHKWTGTVVKVSNSTTRALQAAASGVGSQIGQKTGIAPKSNPDGTPGAAPKGLRGVINRSLVAASIVLDGVDQAGDRLINSGAAASNRVVEHRYGGEAREVAGHAGGIVKGCYAVYKDVAGVRRKCLLSVAGGTFKAKMDDGREVVMKVDDSAPYTPAYTPITSGAGPSSASSSNARPQIAQSEYNEKSASAFGGDKQVK